MLPHRHQTFGSGDSLVIRTNQRLPPISDLLRDVPLPPSLPSSQLPPGERPYPTIYSPTFPPHLLCSPTFCPGAFPTWSTSPPLSWSASQQYTQFPASSRPVDSQRKFISYADRDRPRRTIKQQTRPRRGSTLSDPGPQPRRLEAAATCQPAPPGPCTTAAGPPKPKRNNQPFTFEQEAFVIYHRVELGLPWAEVRDAFMARWPVPARSVGGLQCAYYRTNLELPVVTPEGLLVLVDPGEEEEGGEAAGELAQMTPPASPGAPTSPSPSHASLSSSSPPPSAGGVVVVEGARGGGSEPGGSPGRPREWYKLYRGVAYRTRMVKCRSARISLTERFPEELLDERNDWVREEHRVAARDAAERRRRQREGWLAAQAMRKRRKVINGLN
ncbi:hypothetical protein VTH06DRAFT_3744 [Thermothelomyces fergusii]